MKKNKGWAIVTRRGVLVGGGTKNYGYTPLCVFSTRIGAKEHLSSTFRNDIVIPCKIILSPKGKGKK